MDIELGAKRYDFTAAESAPEFLRVSRRDIRKTFDASDGTTGVCLGGNAPYITIFLPARMSAEYRQYVRENEVDYYQADLDAGRGGATWTRSELIRDTRAQMIFCPAKDWAKVIRFCPGPHDLHYMHGDFRASRAGNPCFRADANGAQTLVCASWQKGGRTPYNAGAPEIRWNFVKGNPPPGVPKYRAHDWDFEAVRGYHAPEILVDVPAAYLKFAALTMSHNHGAGTYWFVVDRLQ